MLISSGNQSTMPQVFKENEGASIAKGEHARLSSFIGAIAVADLVKTTLGPKGMDKMLVSGAPGPHGGDVTVTNDGATILKKVPVDNPAARVLVNISMTQDDEVGDGTTSVVVLAGELLREAEKLTMRKIHPQTIIRGWRVAVKEAINCLDRSAVDNKSNKKKFRQDLVNIAKTTLSSKIVTAELEFFAELTVQAVLRLKGSVDLDMIQIVKKQGGSMKDSFLDDGFILDKCFGLSQPTTYVKPRIMVANTAMDTDKIKIWGAKVKVHSMEEVANIEKAEKEKMRLKVQKIIKHNIDIFINRQLIYDYPEELLTQAKVGSIEHADFEGVERLARVLGAEIMSTFDVPSDMKSSSKSDEKKQDSGKQHSSAVNKSDTSKSDSGSGASGGTGSDDIAVTSSKSGDKGKDETVDDRKDNDFTHGSYLGTCTKVEQIMIGEDSVIKFSGVAKGEACTIVLRGASMHLLDEMERSLHDALCVLTQTVKQSKVVLGGGASEMNMANAVEVAARKHSGKEALAMDAFANALRSIPTILADNAGFDAPDIVTKLRAEHAQGRTHMGVDMETRDIGDMRQRGVTESYKSKSQSLISAHEAAEMILRVDDIVKCAPRRRDAGH